MTTPDTTPDVAVDREEGRRRFRSNLVRVMTVQIISLVVLWLVQRHFSP